MGGFSDTSASDDAKSSEALHEHEPKENQHLQQQDAEVDDKATSAADFADPVPGSDGTRKPNDPSRRDLPFEGSANNSSAEPDTPQGPSARQMLYGWVSAAVHATVALLIWGAAATSLVPVWWSVLMGLAWLLLLVYGLLRWRRTGTILGLSNLFFILWVTGTLLVRS